MAIEETDIVASTVKPYITIGMGRNHQNRKRCVLRIKGNYLVFNPNDLENIIELLNEYRQSAVDSLT